MKIIKGKILGAKKCCVYGPEGIGKSTFASKFPEPIFIDTEGSTKNLDVSRFEKPSSWQMLLEQIKYVKEHPDICKTLVIDTIDWAEQMCIADICARHHKDGLESFGYGNGYVYVKEEFGRFLNQLSDVVDAGINVVLTAHAQIRKFEQPDELGAYDRWELKLGKKTQSQTSPLVKEWTDLLLFANYKTFVINVDGQGVQKGKNKAQGGKRVMYTSHHSCWDAKNRYGLPEEMPFEYEAIRAVMENQEADGKRRETTAQNAAEQPVSEQEYFPEPKSSPKPETETKRTAPVDSKQEPVAENKQMELNLKAGTSIEPDPRIKKSLRDLMIANDICEWDIQNVCEAKGYVPVGTSVRDYDEVNPGIVDGLLVASWDQVYAAIQEMKEKDALVFN